MAGHDTHANQLEYQYIIESRQKKNIKWSLMRTKNILAEYLYSMRHLSNIGRSIDCSEVLWNATICKNDNQINGMWAEQYSYKLEKELNASKHRTCTWNCRPFLMKSMINSALCRLNTKVLLHIFDFISLHLQHFSLFLILLVFCGRHKMPNKENARFCWPFQYCPFVINQNVNSNWISRQKRLHICTWSTRSILFNLLQR